MSEVLEMKNDEAEAATPAKKKRGRPVIGNVRSKNLRTQQRATKEAPTGFVPETVPNVAGRMVTHPRQGPWNLAKANCIMLYEDDTKPMVEPFQLGTLPVIEVMRGKEVIIPRDIYSVLRDKMHLTIACDNSDPNKPRLYEKMVTTMPFQDLGERTWDEYLEFLAAEAKKKHFNGKEA